MGEAQSSALTTIPEDPSAIVVMADPPKVFLSPPRKPKGIKNTMLARKKEKALLLREFRREILKQTGEKSEFYYKVKNMKEAPSWYKGGPIPPLLNAHKSQNPKLLTMPKYWKKPGTKTYKKRRNSRASVGAPRVRYPSRVPRLNAKKVADNVRGILYPHANSKPRHMDGATAESQTQYTKVVTELTIAANKTAVLCLVPFANTVFSYNVDIAATAFNSIFGDFADIAIDTSGMTAGATGVMKREGAIDRWRTVSKGMKCTLLNTHEQNDGWFESFRVTSTPAIDQVFVADKSGTAGSAQIANNNDYLLEAYNNRFASQARTSFVADSLKNLSKYYFRLNPFAEEHPFKDINENYTVSSTGGFSAGPPRSWVPDSGDTQSYRPLVDSYYDHTYDCVCLIIHSGANGSKVLLDAVSNIEVVYNNDSTLARFHDPTIINQAAHRAAHTAANTAPQAGIAIASA